MSVQIGERAPDFSLPTDGNGSVSLSKLKGKKVVLE
jgi:thioredoxin-dependent peroxiredoxin